MESLSSPPSMKGLGGREDEVSCIGFHYLGLPSTAYNVYHVYVICIDRRVKHAKRITL